MSPAQPPKQTPKHLIQCFLSNIPLQIILIIPFVLQITGTVGLVGYLSLRNGQKAVNDLASQFRDELTGRIERELKSYLSLPPIINQLNATAFAQGELNIANPENLSQFIQQGKLFPFSYGIYCATQNGDHLSVGQKSFTDPNFSAWILNRSVSKYFYSYDLDTQGNRIKSTKREEKEYGTYDPRTRPWYEAAVQQKQAVWSDVYVDFDLGSRLLMITAAQPVYAPDTQELIGVCGTDVLLLQEFRKFLASLKIGKTGEAFVINRSGQIISSSSSEALSVGSGDEAKLIQATQSDNQLIRGTAAFLEQKFGGFQQIQQSQQLDFKLNGHREFIQILPFQDGKGLDWLIIVVIPESDFMAQINANTRNTILLCLVALLTAIGLGIFTARRIAHPIDRITKASEDMADGSLEQVIEPSHILELDKLSNSFNRMAGQLEELITGLEDKVQERTEELADANAEISALNQQLQAENLRLAAELSVARKLQQMILPKDEELKQISELDISGFMEPADEVAGDYYDVLRHNNGIKINIGDVTGHGLESGVMMLMTQTAIRALMQHEATSSTKFLSILNQLIYDSVQRMDLDKTLSLAMLDYHAGYVSLSGQHEVVIVVRADGQIECIDTDELGFPLGLVNNIDEFIHQKEVQLQSGDGIVLYTDGIIEATNSQRQLYGLKRLCQVVSQHWSATADDIQKAVVADVLQHIGDSKIWDDITLLIIKQK